MSAFDRLGDRLEGKGRLVLYAIGGLLALGLLAYLYSWRSDRRTNEARAALGRAIDITQATVSPSPVPGAQGPVFATERERAQRAAEEFQKVQDKYGDPFKTQARYFKAASLLIVDRAQGVSELEAMSRGGEETVADWAKYALAQARESDGQLDAAASLYGELAKDEDSAVPVETAKLRLAAVYEKQGKKAEATELLFRIVETARQAKDKDGKPIDQSTATREAAQTLQRLDAARHAQLPPEPPRELP